MLTLNNQNKYSILFLTAPTFLESHFAQSVVFADVLLCNVPKEVSQL